MKYLILMPIGLANEPGIIPTLDGTSGELVTTVSISDPVSWASVG